MLKYFTRKRLAPISLRQGIRKYRDWTVLMTQYSRRIKKKSTLVSVFEKLWIHHRVDGEAVSVKKNLRIQKYPDTTHPVQGDGGGGGGGSTGIQIEITSSKVRTFEHRKTNELARRTNTFSDTLQRVNKYRTTQFPWCYLFISVVLRFMCEIWPKKS